jgi:flagellar secretion chaperone FliS
MYQAAMRVGDAGAQYRTIDVTSKVEGASPHRLIAILYEELVVALATVKLSIRRGAAAQLNEAQARGIAILHGLEHSLDFDKGGDVARALAVVYGEVGRLTAAGIAARDVAKVEQAQKIVADIADAWGQIRS